jgi:hypothetical protein
LLPETVAGTDAAADADAAGRHSTEVATKVTGRSAVDKPASSADGARCPVANDQVKGGNEDELERSTSTSSSSSSSSLSPEASAEANIVVDDGDDDDVPDFSTSIETVDAFIVATVAAAAAATVEAAVAAAVEAAVSRETWRSSIKSESAVWVAEASSSTSSSTEAPAFALASTVCISSTMAAVAAKHASRPGTVPMRSRMPRTMWSRTSAWARS